MREEKELADEMAASLQRQLDLELPKQVLALDSCKRECEVSCQLSCSVCVQLTLTLTLTLTRGQLSVVL